VGRVARVRTPALTLAVNNGYRYYLLPERLQGDRFGQHSIRVNDRWRICFRWRDGHAHGVEIVDYH
jgi:plasmid maintenance system killer protein